MHGIFTRHEDNDNTIERVLFVLVEQSQSNKLLDYDVVCHRRVTVAGWGRTPPQLLQFLHNLCQWPRTPLQSAHEERRYLDQISPEHSLHVLHFSPVEF